MTSDGIDYGEPFLEISLQCFSLLVRRTIFPRQYEPRAQAYDLGRTGSSGT